MGVGGGRSSQEEGRRGKDMRRGRGLKEERESG